MNKVMDMVADETDLAPIKEIFPRELEYLPPRILILEHLGGLKKDIEKKIQLRFWAFKNDGTAIEVNDKFKLKVRINNLFSLEGGNFRNVKISFKASGWVQLLSPSVQEIGYLYNGRGKSVVFDLKAIGARPSFDPTVVEDIGDIKAYGDFDYERFFRFLKSNNEVNVDLRPDTGS